MPNNARQQSHGKRKNELGGLCVGTGKAAWVGDMCKRGGSKPGAIAVECTEVVECKCLVGRQVKWRAETGAPESSACAKMSLGSGRAVSEICFSCLRRN